MGVHPQYQWELNEQAIAQASKTDGVFPLITNTDLAASQVLRRYKDQPFLEKRMYTKKTVLEVAPVFLKWHTHTSNGERAQRVA